MTANYGGEELRAELARLGYEITTGESKLYAENARDASAKVVRELLVRESLAAGVPSSETAFVAVRSEAGQPITETRIVANALPTGWSDGFVGGGAGGSGGMLFSCLSAPAAPMDDTDTESVDSMLMDFSAGDLGTTTTDFNADAAVYGAAPQMRKAAPPPPSAPPTAMCMLGLQPQFTEVRISVTAGQHAPADGAVLFDSASDDEGQFTFLSVAFTGNAPAALDPELTLLLFVGDLAAPRARVRLADVLRQGGRRPLNLSRAAHEAVRLTLEDPAGAWAGGVPALEIVLGWKA